MPEPIDEPEETYDLPVATRLGSLRPQDYAGVRIGPDDTPPKPREPILDEDD